MALEQILILHTFKSDFNTFLINRMKNQEVKMIRFNKSQCVLFIFYSISLLQLISEIQNTNLGNKAKKIFTPLQRGQAVNKTLIEYEDHGFESIQDVYG